MASDSRISLVLLCLFAISNAFYIPGISIRSYAEGDPITLFVNKVFSSSTQLPFAYFDLPFVCPPSRKQVGSFISGDGVSLGLGEVLRGDRIRASDYEIAMGKDVECRVLCTKTANRHDLQRARELIKENYLVEWILDNLPGATSFISFDKKRRYYSAGFRLGRKERSQSTGHMQHLLHNHVTLLVRWRKAPGRDGQHGKRVVVGFEVFPKSMGVEDRTDGCSASLDHENGFDLRIPPGANSTTGKTVVKYPNSAYQTSELIEDMEDGATIDIPFTYSVYFKEDTSIEWANRWAPYFINQDRASGLHTVSLIFSVMLAVALTGVVAVIFARTLRNNLRVIPKVEEGKKDKKENFGLLESDDDDDLSGWKLVHGDVFRPPPYGGLLAPLVGSGIQLLVMSAGLVSLGCIGVLNPSWRGGFVTVGYALFVFAGLFSGYFSSRLYKTWGGQNWRKNMAITATLFPGLAFSLVFVLNLFTWSQSSSIAMPITTLFMLVFVWLFFQVPIVYLGSYLGFVRSNAWEHPTKTNLVPRQIPLQPWYLQGIQAVLMAGAVPFIVILVELVFLFQSLWQDKSSYYYIFGFLGVTSVVLVVAVAEITIVAVYFKLVAEDYRWWWFSFQIGGGGACWTFIYCVWYFFTSLKISGFVSSVMFFGYSFLACSVFGLLTGTIGILCGYAFTRRLYSAVKAD